MPLLDEHDIDKGLYALFNASAALKAAIGTPPRIHMYLPPNVTFPCCRVDHIMVSPWTGFMTSAGASEWVQRERRQFNTFSHETSIDEAAAIQKLMWDIIRTAPSNISITGGVMQSAIPDFHYTDFDEETGDAVATMQWTFSVEATS